MSLLIGVAVLIGLWFVSAFVARASPALLVKTMRRAGGVLVGAAAILLLTRGQIELAIAAGGLAGWLLELPGFHVPGWAQRTQPSTGSVSRVRSALLEMTLDHDSGALSGKVLAGPFEGRTLDALSEPELAQLAALCRQSDADGLRLLQSYLDRRFPGRGEAAQAHTDAGGGPGPRRGGTDAMSEQEAYEVLGLQPGARTEEIRHAHRELMKKLHPDQGGSTYFATRVNQAKDILLNRHR